jgi:hypothetical protein
VSPARKHNPWHGKSAYARIPNDAYFTVDDRCVPVLVEGLSAAGLRLLPEPLMEPSIGAFDLAKQLRAAGVREIVGCDILRYAPVPKGMRFELADFLSLSAPLSFNGRLARSIVGNPPNKLSVEFVEHSLRLMMPANDNPGGVVAMLVPLAWDAAPGRRSLVRQAPFAMRLPLPFRPWWSRDDRRASPRAHWQWLVWDWGCRAAAQARYA